MNSEEDDNAQKEVYILRSLGLLRVSICPCSEAAGLLLVVLEDCS